MVSTGRDPAVIRLTVLGGLDAFDARGERLDALLAQPRRLAMLAFLAMESVRGACARERVMAMFWPDANPQQASTNLRQAIAFLRRELGESVILNVGQHALRVDGARLLCDAVDRLSSGHETVVPVQEEEFLAGVHLSGVGEAWEDWVSTQRHRLRAAAGLGEGTPADDDYGPGGAAEATPSDPQARAAYLRGRFHWNRRPRESMKALACLEEAVRLAPDFAPGHAALADVYNTLGSWESGALPSKEAFPKAQAAARRALAIEPMCAPAHTSLAYALAHHGWDWAAAEHQFDRALALDPHYAHAHHWRAHLLVARQQWDDALKAGQMALALQPVDVIINVHLAWHYWLARQPEAAMEQADRTEALDDTDHWPPFFRGMACAMCGRGAEAVDNLREACQRGKGNAVMRAGLGYACRR